MLKLSSLRADLQRQYQGDWVDYPPWRGVRFRVSSLRLPDYQQATDELAKQFARRYKDKRVPGPELIAAEGRLVAEHLLHDWDGIDEPYTPELAEQKLTDPEYEELLRAVTWCARRLAEVDAEFVEDLEKNFAAPCAISLRARA